MFTRFVLSACIASTVALAADWARADIPETCPPASSAFKAPSKPHGYYWLQGGPEKADGSHDRSPRWCSPEAWVAERSPITCPDGKSVQMVVGDGYRTFQCI